MLIFSAPRTSGTGFICHMPVCRQAGNLPIGRQVPNGHYRKAGQALLGLRRVVGISIGHFET